MWALASDSYRAELDVQLAHAREREDTMNTTKIKHAGLGLAVATTLLFAANAACAASSDYKFEAAGPLSDETLTVRLIDEATGTPVTNAHVFAIHRQQLPVKGEPRFIDRRIALTPDGNGGFIYEGNDVQAGVTIRFVAQVGESDTDIQGSVRVGP